MVTSKNSIIRIIALITVVAFVVTNCGLGYAYDNTSKLRQVNIRQSKTAADALGKEINSSMPAPQEEVSAPATGEAKAGKASAYAVGNLNDRVFEKHIDEQEAAGNQCWFYSIDIKNLFFINGVFDEEVGSLFKRKVVAIIKDVVKRHNGVARKAGGDEVEAVLAEGSLGKKEDIKAVEKRVEAILLEINLQIRKAFEGRYGFVSLKNTTQPKKRQIKVAFAEKRGYRIIVRPQERIGARLGKSPTIDQLFLFFRKSKGTDSVSEARRLFQSAGLNRDLVKAEDAEVKPPYVRASAVRVRGTKGIDKMQDRLMRSRNDAEEGVSILKDIERSNPTYSQDMRVLVGVEVDLRQNGPRTGRETERSSGNPLLISREESPSVRIVPIDEAYKVIDSKPNMDYLFLLVKQKIVPEDEGLLEEFRAKRSATGRKIGPQPDIFGPKDVNSVDSLGARTLDDLIYLSKINLSENLKGVSGQPDDFIGWKRPATFLLILPRPKKARGEPALLPDNEALLGLISRASATINRITQQKGFRIFLTAFSVDTKDLPKNNGNVSEQIKEKFSVFEEDMSPLNGDRSSTEDTVIAYSQHNGTWEYRMSDVAIAKAAMRYYYRDRLKAEDARNDAMLEILCARHPKLAARYAAGAAGVDAKGTGKARLIGDDEARKLADDVRKALGIEGSLAYEEPYMISGRRIDFGYTPDKICYRIGPLVFVSLSMILSMARIKDMVEQQEIDSLVYETILREAVSAYQGLLEEKLGEFYIKNKANIIFVNPFSLEDNKKAIENYSADTIAAMLANQEAIQGAEFIDAGAGMGLLSTVALRLGAEHAVLIENDDFALGAASALLVSQGFREGGQEPGDFAAWKTDLRDRQALDQKIRAMDLSGMRVIGCANIGPWKEYGEANQKALEFLTALPNLAALFNGGYYLGPDIVSTITMEYEDPGADIVHSHQQQLSQASDFLAGNLAGKGFNIEQVRRGNRGLLVAVARAEGAGIQSRSDFLKTLGLLVFTAAVTPAALMSCVKEEPPKIKEGILPGIHVQGEGIELRLKSFLGDWMSEFFARLEPYASPENLKDYEIRLRQEAAKIGHPMQDFADKMAELVGLGFSRKNAQDDQQENDIVNRILELVNKLNKDYLYQYGFYIRIPNVKAGFFLSYAIEEKHEFNIYGRTVYGIFVRPMYNEEKLKFEENAFGFRVIREDFAVVNSAARDYETAIFDPSMYKKDGISENEDITERLKWTTLIHELRHRLDVLDASHRNFKLAVGKLDTDEKRFNLSVNQEMSACLAQIGLSEMPFMSLWQLGERAKTHAKNTDSGLAAVAVLDLISQEAAVQGLISKSIRQLLSEKTGVSIGQKTKDDTPKELLDACVSGKISDAEFDEIIDNFVLGLFHDQAVTKQVLQGLCAAAYRKWFGAPMAVPQDYTAEALAAKTQSGVAAVATARAEGAEARADGTQKPEFNVGLINPSSERLSILTQEFMLATHNLTKNRETDYVKTFRLACSINPQLKSQFSEQELGHANTDMFLRFGKSLTRQIFIPAGIVLIIDIYDSRMIPHLGFIDQQSWKRIDYLGMTIWAADVRWRATASPAVAMDNFIFIDSRMETQGAINTYLGLKEGTSPAINIYFHTLIGWLKKSGLDDPLVYADFCGVKRLYGEEIQHVKDNLFAARLNGVPAEEVDHIVKAEAILKPPHLSQLRSNLWDRLISEPTEKRVQFAAILSEFAGHVGGVIAEIESAISDGKRKLAYALFLDFMGTEETSRNGYSWSALSEVYDFAADLIISGMHDIAGINSTDELFGYLESGPDHPADKALALLKKIYAADFYDESERKVILASKASGAGQARADGHEPLAQPAASTASAQAKAEGALQLLRDINERRIHARVLIGGQKSVLYHAINPKAEVVLRASDIENPGDFIHRLQAEYGLELTDTVLAYNSEFDSTGNIFSITIFAAPVSGISGVLRDEPDDRIVIYNQKIVVDLNDRSILFWHMYINPGIRNNGITAIALSHAQRVFFEEYFGGFEVVALATHLYSMQDLLRCYDADLDFKKASSDTNLANHKIRFGLLREGIDALLSLGLITKQQWEEFEGRDMVPLSAIFEILRGNWAKDSNGHNTLKGILGALKALRRKASSPAEYERIMQLIKEINGFFIRGVVETIPSDAAAAGTSASEVPSEARGAGGAGAAATGNELAEFVEDCQRQLDLIKGYIDAANIPEAQKEKQIQQCLAAITAGIEGLAKEFNMPDVKSYLRDKLQCLIIPMFVTDGQYKAVNKLLEVMEAELVELKNINQASFLQAVKEYRAGAKGAGEASEAAEGREVPSEARGADGGPTNAKVTGEEIVGNVISSDATVPMVCRGIKDHGAYLLRVGGALFYDPDFGDLPETGQSVMAVKGINVLGYNPRITAGAIVAINSIKQFINGRNVIDYGAAKGILGLYAARQQARNIIFVERNVSYHNDIRENAAENALPEEKYKIFTGNETDFPGQLAQYVPDSVLIVSTGYDSGRRILENIIAQSSNKPAIIIATGGFASAADRVKALLGDKEWDFESITAGEYVTLIAKTRADGAAAAPIKPTGLLLRGILDINQNDYRKIRTEGFMPKTDGGVSKDPQNYFPKKVSLSLCMDGVFNASSLLSYGPLRGQTRGGTPTNVAFIIDPEYARLHPERFELVGESFFNDRKGFAQGLVLLGLDEKPAKPQEKAFHDEILATYAPREAVIGIMVHPSMSREILAWDETLGLPHLPMYEIDYSNALADEIFPYKPESAPAAGKANLTATARADGGAEANAGAQDGAKGTGEVNDLLADEKEMQRMPQFPRAMTVNLLDDTLKSLPFSNGEFEEFFYSGDQVEMATDGYLSPHRLKNICAVTDPCVFMIIYNRKNKKVYYAHSLGHNFVDMRRRLESAIGDFGYSRDVVVYFAGLNIGIPKFSALEDGLAIYGKDLKFVERDIAELIETAGCSGYKVIQAIPHWVGIIVATAFDPVSGILAIKEEGNPADDVGYGLRREDFKRQLLEAAAAEVPEPLAGKADAEELGFRAGRADGGTIGAKGIEEGVEGGVISANATIPMVCRGITGRGAYLLRVGGALFYDPDFGDLPETGQSVMAVKGINVLGYNPRITAGAIVAIDSIKQFINGRNVIDYGAAKGILGLYAARQQADNIIFVERNASYHNDIRGNAAENALPEEKYKIFTGTETDFQGQLAQYVSDSLLIVSTGYDSGRRILENVIAQISNKPAIIIATGGFASAADRVKTLLGDKEWNFESIVAGEYVTLVAKRKDLQSVALTAAAAKVGADGADKANAAAQSVTATAGEQRMEEIWGIYDTPEALNEIMEAVPDSVNITYKELPAGLTERQDIINGIKSGNIKVIIHLHNNTLLVFSDLDDIQKAELTDENKSEWKQLIYSL